MSVILRFHHGAMPECPADEVTSGAAHLGRLATEMSAVFSGRMASGPRGGTTGP